MASQPPREAVPSSEPPASAGASDDELRLVAAVLRKDRKAAAEFVSRHADGVYAYVRHRLAPRQDLVEDLVHDVFLAALAGLSRFTGTASLRAWLLGIARHKVEDYYRRQLREPEPLPDTPDAGEPASNDLIDEIVDRRRLAEKTDRILGQLPEAYGLALLWRYWENRSVREMAAATGRTEKAIERLLARARARFRQLWDRM
jgi:RNA polymerase sigma factor (sigma-70 family)